MCGSWTAVDVSYAKFDGELFESIHILVGSHCGGHNGKKLLEKHVLKAKMTIWWILGAIRHFT